MREAEIPLMQNADIECVRTI